jgi:hypothetical protein
MSERQRRSPTNLTKANARNRAKAMNRPATAEEKTNEFDPGAVAAEDAMNGATQKEP